MASPPSGGGRAAAFPGRPRRSLAAGIGAAGESADLVVESELREVGPGDLAKRTYLSFAKREGDPKATQVAATVDQIVGHLPLGPECFFISSDIYIVPHISLRDHSSAAVFDTAPSPFLAQLSQMPFNSKIDPVTVKLASAEILDINFGMIGSIQSLMLPHCRQSKWA